MNLYKPEHMLGPVARLRTDPGFDAPHHQPLEITTQRDLAERSEPRDLRAHLRQAKLSLLGQFSRPARQPSLRLFFCHYVFEDQVKAFAQKIRYLADRGTFLTEEEVLKVIRGAKSLNQPAFHLSFDDGFRNVVTWALPVLRDLDVPATFFVPTSIIGASPDIVRDYCMNTAGHPGVIEMADWDDLGRAQEHGLSIASHTRTHVRFSRISGSNSRMEDEIAGSKADIEARLGSPCRMISWPYGTHTAVDDRSLEFVRRAGYAACFSAIRGQVVPRRTNPFSIPRHHFEAHWPMAQF
ncbi:MAG: polysaccharide deacetylase family protein, partial [Pseudomonadota bacterium]